MPTDSPPFRLLIAAPHRLGPQVTAALAILCPALADQGMTVLVLEGSDGPLRAERRTGPGYTLYRSTRPDADCATLTALEAPQAAVLLGAESLSLAPPLLAAHVPTLLRLDGDHPPALGPLTDNRLLRLASGTLWEAERLSSLIRTAVAILPLPLPPSAPIAKGGRNALILSDEAATGLYLALALAAARPDSPFLLAERAAVSSTALPTNVRVLREGETLPPIRLAVLPQGNGTPPWADLAAVLTAGIPILGGDAPLLATAVGPAGLCLPLATGLPDWLAAFDALRGRTRPTVTICRSQGAQLRPEAAPLWSDVLQQHVRRCRDLSAGPI